jgi:hypothetical protein
MDARTTRSAVVGIFAATALLFTGCGSDDPDPTTSPAPTASTEAPAPVAAIDASMLLPAEQMPPWNGAIVWQEAAAEDLVAPSPVCSLPTPESLGAVSQYTATYSVDAAMSGSNTIMLFADEAAAEEALAAYEAAMPDCLGQEGDQGLLTDDPAASSWTGAQDCSFTGDPACGDNEGLFSFIGVGAADNTAAIVSFNLIGQDANYCLDPQVCPDPRDPVLPEVYASLERMG